MHNKHHTKIKTLNHLDLSSQRQKFPQQENSTLDLFFYIRTDVKLPVYQFKMRSFQVYDGPCSVRPRIMPVNCSLKENGGVR